MSDSLAYQTARSINNLVPIGRIPDEIIGEIMVQTVWREMDELMKAVPSEWTNLCLVYVPILLLTLMNLTSFPAALAGEPSQ